MYAGKTERGFQYVRAAVMGGNNAVVVKHGSDTRYRSELASSHDGTNMRAIVVDSLVEDPIGIGPNVKLIFVDEGQFQAGLAAFCMRQNKMGRDVVVSALNSKGDAERTPWPPVMELIPWVTNLQMLTSICGICHGVANCSRYIGDGVLPTEGNAVGADDKFMATCAECYEVDLPENALKDRAERVAYLKSLSK